MRAILAAFSFLLFISAGAVAEEDTTTGNFVMPGCRAFIAVNRTYDIESSMLKGIYVGTVTGVWDMGELTNEVCAPKVAVVAQAVRVTTKYVDDNPERLHERFSVLVLHALKTAWPCK